MRSIKETNTISEILNSFTFGDKSSKGKSFSDNIKFSTLFSFWEDIIGKKLAKFSKPEKIKYSKIFISAKSPIIAQEISLSKQNILKKINTYSNALGFEINDLVVDYKNYENKSDAQEINEEKPEYYKNDELKNEYIDDDYFNEIKNNICKINFLSSKQKDELIDKIMLVKKAEFKRKTHLDKKQ